VKMNSDEIIHFILGLAYGALILASYLVLA